MSAVTSRCEQIGEYIPPLIGASCGAFIIGYTSVWTFKMSEIFTNCVNSQSVTCQKMRDSRDHHWTLAVVSAGAAFGLSLAFYIKARNASQELKHQKENESLIHLKK